MRVWRTARRTSAGSPRISETAAALLGVLRQGLVRRGLPVRLYVDNGSTFRSRQLALECAKLGIALIHGRPYQPAGRGKIERFFRTVRGWLGTLPGKTTVCRHVTDRLHPELYRVCYVSLSTGNVMDMYKCIGWSSNGIRHERRSLVILSDVVRKLTGATIRSLPTPRAHRASTF